MDKRQLAKKLTEHLGEPIKVVSNMGRTYYNWPAATVPQVQEILGDGKQAIDYKNRPYQRWDDFSRCTVYQDPDGRGIILD